MTQVVIFWYNTSTVKVSTFASPLEGAPMKRLIPVLVAMFLTPVALEAKGIKWERIVQKGAHCFGFYEGTWARIDCLRGRELYALTHDNLTMVDNIRSTGWRHRGQQSIVFGDHWKRSRGGVRVVREGDGHMGPVGRATLGGVIGAAGGYAIGGNGRSAVGGAAAGAAIGLIFGRRKGPKLENADFSEPPPDQQPSTVVIVERDRHQHRRGTTTVPRDPWTSLLQFLAVGAIIIGIVYVWRH